MRGTEGVDNMTVTTEKFDEQSADQEYNKYSSYILDKAVEFKQENPHLP